MSEHQHVSDAIYHPIPQAPVASNPIPSASPDPDPDELPMSPIGPNLPHPKLDPKVHWIHFLLGCAVLLPWNALITATPYFQSRVDGTPLRGIFASYLSMTFTAANLGFLAHATVTAKKASNTRRILSSLAALALLSLLLAASTYTHPAASVFFAFVLVNGVFQAAAGSYLQTAVVAIAALFGPAAMQAIMSGQAAVAVVISGVQVLSALASVRPGDANASAEELAAEQAGPAERSAFIFFGLSTVFLVVCVAVQMYLVSLPVYKTVTGARRRHGSEGASLLASDDEDADMRRELRRVDGKGQVTRVAKQNATFNFAVAYVFVVTLAVFPPITVSVTSTNPAVHPLVFTAVHFLMFNLGDFGGRTLCSFPRLHVWSARRLALLALLRTLFVPLFLLCNVQWGAGAGAARSPVISSDAAFMLLMLLFGGSSGYVSSMCMMAAPSLAHNPRLGGRAEDVDVAATVASFFLVGGLAVGSVVSFAVRGAVCDCNPFAS
ncbi:nucleoside transporter-domain-containing protein [Epithele typhae]|uniref:nucleoside transporter-domain-containing protein n=1 Tax=Epithele typhae TaxID=378194 RepID=UPI002008A7F2|nr:nucleoside transporter-domain-containing protein [Epithele typhae]KAH9927120.1 nucleoside transporter-domain-containing protein [Epithele typhae]